MILRGSRIVNQNASQSFGALNARTLSLDPLRRCGQLISDVLRLCSLSAQETSLFLRNGGANNEHLLVVLSRCTSMHEDIISASASLSSLCNNTSIEAGGEEHDAAMELLARMHVAQARLETAIASSAAQTGVQGAVINACVVSLTRVQRQYQLQ